MHEVAQSSKGNVIDTTMLIDGVQFSLPRLPTDARFSEVERLEKQGGMFASDRNKSPTEGKNRKTICYPWEHSEILTCYTCCWWYRSSLA